jgi:hypothetical protein
MPQVIEEDGLTFAGEGHRASTITVLMLLAVAALVFSYLGAYAVMGALVSADVVAPPPPGEDPRLMNMAKGFCALMTLFTVFAGTARFMSSRQLRKIEAMEEI